MDHFAKAIRQRPHLLETAEDVNALKRKLLASQTRNLAVVYPYVGSDLKAIQHRAPDALERYEPEPAFLQELLSEATVDWKSAGDQSSFHAFQNQIKPPAGKELFAYFCKGRYDCDQILDSATLKAIRLYKPDHPETDIQIGKLIASMSWPDREEILEVIEEPVEIEEAHEELDRSHVNRRIELPIDEPKQWNEAEERERAVYKDYKAAAGIGGLFSTQKVATQILLGALAPERQQERILRGKKQVRYPETAVESHMYDIVDTWPSETIARMVATEQAQDFYWACAEKPAEGRSLVKMLLQQPTEGIHKRYTKKWGKIVGDNLVNEMLL